MIRESLKLLMNRSNRRKVLECGSKSARHRLGKLLQVRSAMECCSKADSPPLFPIMGNCLRRPGERCRAELATALQDASAHPKVDGFGAWLYGSELVPAGTTGNSPAFQRRVSDGIDLKFRRDGWVLRGAISMPAVHGTIASSKRKDTSREINEYRRPPKIRPGRAELPPWPNFYSSK